MFSKNKVAMLLAEFFGTFVLASVVLASVTKISIPFFAAVAAGSALALMVLIIGKVSGAHINPAVTFGLWSIRKVPAPQAIVYIAAQVLGGISALALASYLLGEALSSIAGKNFDWRVFVAETVGTFVFSFGIAAAVNQKLEDGRLAVAIGLSLFVGILVASMGSNGILNPAVAVGLNSISVSYIAGPLVGALLGMNVHKFFFANEESSKKKSKKK